MRIADRASFVNLLRQMRSGGQESTMEARGRGRLSAPHEAAVSAIDGLLSPTLSSILLRPARSGTMEDRMEEREKILADRFTVECATVSLKEIYPPKVRGNLGSADGIK